jgi:hypothetical protein
VIGGHLLKLVEAKHDAIEPWKRDLVTDRGGP